MKSYITRKKSFVTDGNNYLPVMDKTERNDCLMWIQKKGIRHLIGLRLRQAREKKGFSQMDLAYLIGNDQQYVSKVESGKINISVENLFKITYHLGLYINLEEKTKKENVF